MDGQRELVSAMDSKFSPEERARICAEADYYCGRGPKPASLEPKPAPVQVQREAPTNGLVYKTHESIEQPAADQCGEEWTEWARAHVRKGTEECNEWTRTHVAQEVKDLAAELTEAVAEAVGERIGKERIAMRAHVKAANDDLRRELAE